jgi:hydrogenase expression/formation protein HypE
MAVTSDDKILMAHGGGGQLSEDLIRQVILPRLQAKGRITHHQTDAVLYDAATFVAGSERLCMTTDSYVVKPLFFPGGDIGRLAVCGTVNDLAVSGAYPVALSLALIIEEGLPLATLERVMDSIGQAAGHNRIQIVTGDTKTVEAGSADGLFINTTGVGIRRPSANLGFERVTPGDKVILSGTLGDHGMTILSQRQDIGFESRIQSDCAGLAGLIGLLLEAAAGDIRFMRDPTRGGLAATLNEIVRGSGHTIEIREDQIPVDPAVQAAAEMLGLDVLNVANEGKFVAVVASESAERCLDLCRGHELGSNAAIIGQVKQASQVPVVEMVTRIGGRRIVQMPYGRELPRIC